MTEWAFYYNRGTCVFKLDQNHLGTLSQIYPYIYRPRSLAKQGENALGSVRPFVCLSTCQGRRSSDLAVRGRLDGQTDGRTDVTNYITSLASR